MFQDYFNKLKLFLMHFLRYILWVSSVMQTHSAEKACLHLSNLNESVSLSAVLEYDGYNTTIFDQSVEEDNFYVSQKSKSSEQLAFVTLLAKGETLRIFERRSVALTSEETVTFMQTDKPIYKPGENVQIRIVTLDTKFRPVEDLDPQNNRIFQWQNVTSFQNITQLSFQLISEPMFGDYSIFVRRKSGKTLTHQFTVDRYGNQLLLVVVPYECRYCTLSPTRYTYGQPVQGKAQIRVCRKFFSSGNCEHNNNEICEQFTAQVQIIIFTQKKKFFFISFCPSLSFSYQATYIRPLSCYPSSWLAPEYVDAHFSVSRFYSRTNSFLKIAPEPKQLRCNQQKIVTVHYSLNGEAYGDDSNINFFYLVMVKGAIFLSGQKEIRNKAWNGNFSFPINIDADLAPVAVMLVYTLHPSGEIVADSARFQVDKCFKNKVSIKFSKEQGLPGSSTSLYLQAAPDSFCALRAVDKSVLLLKAEQQLSAESVSPRISSFSSRFLPFSLCFFVCFVCHGSPYLYSLQRKHFSFLLASGGMKENFDFIEQAVRETVRTNFPETWIWDLVSVDSSGSANLSFRIPDTITQWQADGFCVNGDAGFGISSTTTLEISQPFFVETTLPFSIVRNEQSDLIVNVFSYLNTCVEVSWANYHLTYIRECFPGKVNITIVAESRPSTACPEEGAEQQNLNWKDTVVKSLLVEVLINAEMPTRSRSNLLLFLFLGDILGLAMQNLENLLQMPYGCGEQNVALLASDTYVLDYLKSTKQLTEEVKSKAFFFLSNGYQKQLSFKNYDGSYSVFQQRNQKGSMWLSALTFKTLERMKEYVYVDEQVQKETLIWLSSKQNINGCFKSDGKLFNNAWEGGDEEDILFTAYVVGAFLEAGLNFTFPAVRNGLFCLEEALEGGITNGYIHAILAYAFALAEREKQVESLLQILDQSATKTNNVIYWERAKKPKTEASPSFIPHAPSAETEKTCYVLLALLSKKTPDLTYASKIVQWLAQQMNSHGGFSSTQDTVVALQALSKYGAATFSKREKAAVVTVKSSETFSEEFQVHDANRLLLQEVRLPEIPGEYSTTVSGSGCVYLQTSLRYNVLPKKEGKVPFTLKVDTLSQNCDGVHAHRKVQIHINISYTGERPSSNMVIVDVKMISGFIPVKSSVRKLQEKPQIQRTDMSTNHVLIYFEELTNQTLSFSFSVEQDIQVDNLKPATVKAYDYYETGERPSYILPFAHDFELETYQHHNIW
uniref:Uncharacterized protein n=1 Tax=Ailuropoda melanoleuca TaxID=9646 RepID=G1LBI2_AILME